jgi:hypothetical protein
MIFPSYFLGITVVRRSGGAVLRADKLPPSGRRFDLR